MTRPRALWPAPGRIRNPGGFLVARRDEAPQNDRAGRDEAPRKDRSRRGFAPHCRRCRLGRRPDGEAAAGALGEGAEPRADARSQVGRGEAPPPVAAGAAGQVHAGLGPRAQHVLQRHDRGVGHRDEESPDEVPVDGGSVPTAVGERPVVLLARPRPRCGSSPPPPPSTSPRRCRCRGCRCRRPCSGCSCGAGSRWPARPCRRRTAGWPCPGSRSGRAAPRLPG